MEAQLDVRKSTSDALHSLNNFFFIARVYERSFESESRRCQNDFFRNELYKFVCRRQANKIPASAER